MDHEVGMLLWWALGLPAVATLAWIAGQWWHRTQETNRPGR